MSGKFFEIPDHSTFDPKNDDQKKINNGHAVPCRICSDFFARETLTFRYCIDCKRAFCEGIHGSFSQVAKSPIGKCVVCMSK